jgi:preprotein translocase SecE subunit
MARTRQKAKQRKAKRLEEERKAAQRTQPGDGADAATREAIAEVEQAQRDAAAELAEAQDTEVGAGAEAARSAAAVEAAAGAEAVSTGRVRPAPKADEAPARVSRRDRRRAEAAKEESRKPAAPARRARPTRADRKKKEDVRQRGRVINFFIQVWAELRRVQWPDRAQVTQATAVVVVFCLVAGAYLGILDYVFNKLVKEFL